MGRLVLTVVGTAVGAYFGMPGLGYAAGSLLGGAIFGSGNSNVEQHVEGSKLSDLKVTGVEYGQPIPWITGKPRIAGQIWWSSNRRQIPHTTTTTQTSSGGGGKGGGGGDSQTQTTTTTTYTYDVDMWIGLADNEILTITRGWWNGKLFYEDGLDISDVYERLTIYTGAPDQMPDPTYEAWVSTPFATAHRGRGSVFIQGLHLGQSGQIPNLTFEVVGKTDVTFVVGSTDFSEAFGVTDLGHTVGVWDRPSNHSISHGFLYQDNIFTDLGTLPDGLDMATAAAISPNGVVTGDAAQQAYRWSIGTGMHQLRSSDPIDFTFPVSHSTAISADGSVIVGYAYFGTAHNYQGFMWTAAGGMIELPTVSGLFDANHLTRPEGISADGLTLAGFEFTVGERVHAYKWTQAGGFVDLGYFDESRDRSAHGISGDGLTVVGTAGVSINVSQAFKHTAGGGMVGLGYLGTGQYSKAVAADYNGLLIVGFSEIDTGTAERMPFLWTAGTNMIALTLPAGFVRGEATAVCPNGNIIVGYGDDADDNTHALLWTDSGTVVYILDGPPLTEAVEDE